MTNVGLIGCGTIGAEIADSICARKAADASLVALFDVDAERASALANRLPLEVPHFTDFDQFLSTAGLELVVECASPVAVRAYAESVLSGGKDLLMLSSGALTDSALYQRLASLAINEGRRLIIPSGALGGIDALRGARGHLDEVTLTSTKPPKGFMGAPGFKEWESKEITEAQVIFDGPANEAIKLFPANVNVGTTLSLAGLGPEKTRVKVVADPNSPDNVHEILAKGDFGIMRVTMENRPHDRNPRTSYLAVLSALETLRAACTTEPKIGT